MSDRLSKPKPSAVKAFRVEVEIVTTETSIILTSSRNRARFKVWQMANDIGYKVKFGDIHVSRAPEYDQSNMVTDTPFDEQYLRRVKEKNPEGGEW